jgi:hypothetical protein
VLTGAGRKGSPDAMPGQGIGWSRLAPVVPKAIGRVYSR